MGSQLTTNGKFVVITCRSIPTKCSWVSHCRRMEKARRHAFAREYETLLEDNWMSHSSPMKHTSTWIATLASKMSDLVLRESKGNCCQPHASTDSYSMVYIIESRNIWSLFHWWYNHFRCLPQFAEWWICPFTDGIWHSNAFVLDSTRWWKRSHEEYCTLLHSWRFWKENSVEQVFWAICRRVFMATNLTEIKAFLLLSVGLFEG